MKHHYPNKSEHALLWEETQLQFYESSSRELEPLYEQASAAVRDGDFDRYRDIDRLIRERQGDLYQQRWRREEILQWLWLDSELRKEGKTYPDIYEAPTPVCSADEF